MYYVVWFDDTSEHEKQFACRWQAEKFAEELSDGDENPDFNYIDVYENDTLLISYCWNGRKYLVQRY